MPRRVLFAAVPALLVGASLFVLFVATGRGTQEPANPPASPHLMVDDLREYGAGPGRSLEVVGVVAGAKASADLFGLIDEREVVACGRVDCPEFVLPVQWEGEMPALGDTVVVRGTVRQTARGMLLAAEGIEKR